MIASASGNGKTTFGRALAQRLGVNFVELDALVHGPDWAETPDAELHALVEPIVRSDAWVIDGTYWRKVGRLVLDAADTVVWLDLPLRVSHGGARGRPSVLRIQWSGCEPSTRWSGG